MAHELKTASVSTVLGELLATPIEFTYEFDTFDTPQAVKDAGEWPNDKDILTFVNSSAERNSLSGARAKAIKSEVDRISGTVEYRRRAWVDNTIKTMPGIDRAVIEGMAAQYIKD